MYVFCIHMHTNLHTTYVPMLLRGARLNDPRRLRSTGGWLYCPTPGKSSWIIGATESVCM